MAGTRAAQYLVTGDGLGVLGQASQPRATPPSTTSAERFRARGVTLGSGKGRSALWGYSPYLEWVDGRTTAPVIRHVDPARLNCRPGPQQ